MQTQTALPEAGTVSRLARLAGSFYLAEILTHIPGVLIRGRLVVPNDAALTASNILSHASLVYTGFATDLIGFACYIAVTALLYRVFRSVSPTLSFVAALFSLAGCTIGAFSCAFTIIPLHLLQSVPYAAAFGAAQVQALALLFFRVYAQCFNTSFVLFGCYCVLIGNLTFRSKFLPRTVGVLMTIAGLGWLTFIYPPAARHLTPGILLPGIIGEGSFTVALLLAFRRREPAELSSRGREPAITVA